MLITESDQTAERSAPPDVAGASAKKARDKLLFVHCNTTGSWLCDKYAHALQQSGANVELAGLRFDGGRNIINGLRDQEVPQVDFGFHYQFRSRMRLLKALERLGVDVRKRFERRRFNRHIRDSGATRFVAADPFALAMCVAAGRQRGGKVFYLPFEHYRDLRGVNERRRRQFIRLERDNLPYVAGALYCGDTILADYVAAYGIADRSHVIYNGWPMAFTAQQKSLRRAIGVPQDKVIILYQGVIDESRGLTDVFAALPQVSTKACVVIIGYGQDSESVMACANDPALKGRVYFLPPVPQQELMNFTADADIGIIPLRDIRGYRYACPGKLFEFIGAGLSLVVSDLPDLRRFVVSYSLGEVFKCGHSSDLARALCALVDSPEYREKCARNSLALHRQKVCWEAQSGKMCEIILS